MNYNLLKGTVYSRGMTMQEMAKKAGIVYSTMIRQFEANNMTIDNVKKIRETLNLSREELIAIFFGE